VAIQVTCSGCGTTLKTSEAHAGKKAKCPKCGGIIEIPALAPPLPADDDEYELEAEPAVRGFSDDELAAGPAQGSAAGPARDRRPCPACGEMIMRDAVKCRYCGEIFDPVLKKKEQKSKAASDEDSTLSVGEWLVCILCSTIGCIVGIVYMIQGKPKGGKMILVSIAVNVIFAVLSVIAQSLQHM
jgi:predicted RNA-binding Zn-ribbon protein involved in translation (DUF1610 family)